MVDLAKKTKVGMIWNAFEKFGVQGISFVLNIILARLLSPSDYGTIGLLTVFLTFSNVFIDSGFSRALIQKQDRSDADFSTAFSFNLIVGLAVYVLLFFAAPFISKFYKVDGLTSLQRVLYLVLIINSLSLVQNTKLQIVVDFKKIAIVTMVSRLFSGVIGIIFAYKGFGAWALVAQSLSGALITTVFYWFIAKWRPTIFFAKESFKHLFGFGSKLLVSGFVATLLNNISSVVIGKAYSTKDLGYYTRGYQFPELVVGSLSSVLNTATFPLISSLQDNKDEMMTVFKRLICVTSLIAYPCMAGMAILSENIILVLLTEKWLPVAFFLSCASLSYIFRPLNILNMNLLNAIGRSDLFLKVDMIKIPIDLVVMVLTLPRGIRIYMAVKVLMSIMYFCINAFIPGRFYGFGPLKQILCAWKGIVATVVMGCVVFILNKVFVFNMIAKLVVLILIGVGIYYLMLKVLKEKELENIELKITRKITSKHCEKIYE